MTVDLDLQQPTVAPDYRVTLGERNITPGIATRLISLRVTDNRGFEADTLDLELDDTDGLLELPERGVTIGISMGWKGSELVDKGTFVVDEVEHNGAPDVLSIRARSADLRTGITNKRERSFSGKTLGEIANTIGGAYGLDVRVSDRLASEVIDHVDQTSESDANLLTRLARDFDAIATVKKGMLLVMPIGEAESVTGVSFPTATIVRQSGDRHRFALAERDAYTAVRAFYQDIDAGKQGEVIYDGKDVRTKTARTEETAKKKRGLYESVVTFFAAAKQTKTYGKVVTSATGKVVTTHQGNIRVLPKKSTDTQMVKSHVYATRKAAEDAGAKEWKTIQEKQRAKEQALIEEINDSASIEEPSTDSMKTLRHTYASKINAERAVRADWKRVQRGLAALSITLAYGRPDLFPELPVAVRGFKPQIDSAEWTISRATHAIEDSGLTSTLDLELQL